MTSPHIRAATQQSTVHLTSDNEINLLKNIATRYDDGSLPFIPAVFSDYNIYNMTCDILCALKSREIRRLIELM